MSNSILNSSYLPDEYLDIALAQVKLGFWELDVRTGDIHCTLQNKLNFGLAPDEDVTRDVIIAAILPEDRAIREEAIQKAMSPEKGLYAVEFRVRQPNQRIYWLQAKGTVIFESDQPVRIIGTTLDITEKKDLELMRDEMLNITNHELKTPLSAIKGYLQLLHRFIVRTGNEQYEKIAHRSLSAVEKITRLFNDSLTVDYRNTNHLVLREEAVNMVQLAEETAANTMLIYEEYQIVVTSDGAVPLINLDKHRIEQVLTNLINNAVKYSPDGDRVEVHITPLETNVKISIRDYGMGIPADEQQRIFQKFYRVRNDHGMITGSGIGLFLCSEIVSRHGGLIGISPVPSGAGTCFYFTLPFKPVV